MKNIFFILIFFSYVTVFAQRDNILIKYRVQIHDEEIMKNIDVDFRRMFLSAISSASLLSFDLLITSKGSKFYEESILVAVDEGNRGNRSAAFAGYSGEVYQYMDEIYFKSSSIDAKMMVKEPLKANWKLHSETKMIDNYLCYKATTVNIVENGSGKTFNHPVIAWFCPKLPYNYGPNGYSNLPGLILELQVRNVVFGAKEIDLNSELDFDSSFLKTAKTISREELNKKIDDEMQLLKG